MDSPAAVYDNNHSSKAAWYLAVIFNSRIEGLPYLFHSFNVPLTIYSYKCCYLLLGSDRNRNFELFFSRCVGTVLLFIQSTGDLATFHCRYFICVLKHNTFLFVMFDNTAKEEKKRDVVLLSFVVNVFFAKNK